MDSSLAALGIVVLTSKIIYRVSAIGYIIVSVGCILAAYCMDKTTQYEIEGDRTACLEYEPSIKATCQWVLYTNIIALLSAVAFFFFTKGTTISVVGMFVWLANILNMLGLFIYAQVLLFNNDIADCRDAASILKVNVGFVRQYDAILTYLIFQYAKFGILFLAYLYYRFCMKGKLLYCVIE